VRRHRELCSFNSQIPSKIVVNLYETCSKHVVMLIIPPKMGKSYADHNTYTLPYGCPLLIASKVIMASPLNVDSLPGKVHIGF
jgi:hypothetical protein